MFISTARQRCEVLAHASFFQQLQAERTTALSQKLPEVSLRGGICVGLEVVLSAGQRAAHLSPAPEIFLPPGYAQQRGIQRHLQRCRMKSEQLLPLGFAGATSVQHRAEFPFSQLESLEEPSPALRWLNSSTDPFFPCCVALSFCGSNHPPQLLVGDEEILACPRSAQLTHAGKPEARTGKPSTVLLPVVIKEIRMKWFTSLPSFYPENPSKAWILLELCCGEEKWRSLYTNRKLK